AAAEVNLIAAGFVDTPLSARLLGDNLEQRRDQLRATLPIRRVVGPADVAALAVHLMTNTALTGATYDIDGGQQIVPASSGSPTARRSGHQRMRRSSGSRGRYRTSSAFSMTGTRVCCTGTPASGSGGRRRRIWSPMPPRRVLPAPPLRPGAQQRASVAVR